MKKLLLIIITAVITVNCKDSSGKEALTNSKPQSQKAKEIMKTTRLSKGCYAFQNDQSRITLEIVTVGKIVTGNLNFMNSGKDQNSGTFTAELNKDVLIGNYVFNSEGVTSAREIAFKVQDDRLLEGFGDLNDDGTAFIDTSKLYFNSEKPLIKTSCKE